VGECVDKSNRDALLVEGVSLCRIASKSAPYDKRADSYLLIFSSSSASGKRRFLGRFDVAKGEGMHSMLILEQFEHGLARSHFCLRLKHEAHEKVCALLSCNGLFSAPVEAKLAIA
jgi:hypothetical protein